MMKFATLLFIIILYMKCCFSISKQNDLQMIVDVVQSYEQPTSIIANVCWKSVYKTKLATMLAKEKSTSIQYSSSTESIASIASNTVFNNHLLLLLDLRCEIPKKILDQVSALHMFSKAYRWLVFIQNNKTMELFTSWNILVDSEFIVAEERDNGKFFLQTIYKIQPNSDWIWEYYGDWSLVKGLMKSEARKISNTMRRKNLQQIPITASLVISDNRTKHDYSDISKNFFVDSATKSSYATLTNVYDFINATRAVIFSETWGYVVNGSWTGMMGDIESGKADLCGCVIFLTTARSSVLHYLSFYGSTPTTRIVFRQPPLSYQFNLFILPFTTNVWYCLAGFVIILIIILYINAKWDVKKYEDYDEVNTDGTWLRAGWSDIIVFVVSAISQQGSSAELKGTLGRLVMFIIFLAFIFFYTSYSANIVVLLQSTSDQIRTITDLTNSKLEIGIEDTVYNRYYFSAAYARDPVRKAFYETKIAPKEAKSNYMSAEEGIRKLQKEPFAFQMMTGSGYRIVSKYFQEHEKCGLLEIDYIQSSKPWLCSKKTSPFNEMYRVGLFRTEEHGLSDRHFRILFEKKPTCTTSSGNFGSVSMMDFYPVLLMLLYGMILAFSILVLEILVHRKLKH